ncbi:MAG TPA: JAB domain-containing protein, partial [Polyangiaceae bacterium]|nr:JAB domain-containing protein [Polyangiaceae bacterium]
TGAEQADRYSLRRYIDRIEYTPLRDESGAPTGRYNVVAFADARYPILRERGASLERIADVFGRAIAERIREGDGHRMDPDTESRALTGVDLEVGGEGMLKFYDEILPRIVEKELRRLGVNQKVERDAVHLTGRTNWREVWNGPALTDEVLDRAEALLVSGTMQKAAGMGRLSKMDGIAAARDVIQPLRERASTPQEREKMLTQNRAAYRATHYQFENAFAALGGQVEIVADDTPVALPSIRVTPELREAIRSEGAMLLEPEMDYDARALADEQNIAWEGGKDEADRMAREIARRNPKEGIFTVNGQPSTARRLLVAGRKSLKTAAVNLRGQVVRRAEDLHRALWTARHPRMEILHIILMDDEGRVHSHVMETSGHVATVSIWGNDRRSAKRFAWEIAHRAQRTGATRVLIAHNHPSGVPTPSNADRMFSRTVSALLETHGLEFVGHYIINDSKATFLVTHPDGSVEEIPVSVDMKSVGDWTEHLGPDIILGPNHLASLIRGVSDPTRFDVVYVTSNNQIVAVEPHRPEAVRTMLHWLPAHGRALGSDRAFIVVDGAAQPGLYEQISDLVAQNRAALREVLDVVDMAEGGVRRTARREQRFDKPPRPPRTPARRLRESEAEYDPWTEEVTRADLRPAARTVSGALELGRIGYEFLADDLINVVRKQGRGGERFAARAERATQSTKSVMGRLAARAKRTLKLVSASPAAQRASWYLQQVQWDGPSGFARIQPVLEGTIPEKRLPARVREWARGQWRLQARMAKMAEDLGILQPLWVTDEETGQPRLVLRKFKGRPGGRIALRMATPYLVDMYMNPRGEAWETYVAEIARLNGWEVPEVEERIREFTERKFRRTHAEIPRLIPVHPTHLRVGGRVIPLLETHPYAYTAASIRSFAHRYGFIREFGQSLDPNADLMEQLRDQAVQDGVDPRTIDNLLKALSGIPLEGPLPAVRPGSAAHEAIAQVQRLVAMVRAGMLTRAAIPNLPEPLGNLQAFGGARRMIQALIDLAPGRYADTVLRLERMGLTAADVANLTIDRDRYLASLSRIWGQSVLRLFGTKPAWEFGEKLAAAQGLRFAQDLMAARGGRFTREMSWLTLRALGYTKREADRLTYEMPRQEFSDVRLAPASVREAYIGVAQRFATRLINSTMTLPAEESRSANSRYWKAWIWFDSYFQMNARTSARSLRNLWEALGTARENPHRLGAALYQLARLHAGKTAAGAIAYALLLFALGGSYGLGQAAREAKEDPLDFLLRAWLYTQFGPIVMSLARVFESRRVEDWRLVSAPVSLIEEVASMVMGWGAYRDLSPIERASRFGDRYFTVKRSIAQFMAAYGLSEEDPKLRAAIREYWAWRRRHDLAPGRYEAGDMEAADREFRRHMRRAYEAMQLEEPDPDEVLRHINRALQAEGKDWSSVAQSLRARRLLTQLDETQREALREYLGEEMYAVLEAHDAVLEAWASAGSRQRRDRRRTRRQSSR